MYLALNGVPIGGNLSWPDFARLASSTGFGGVDLMLGPAMADGVDRTRRLLADLHLRPSFASLPVEFRKDDATFRAGLSKLEDAAPFCAALSPAPFPPAGVGEELPHDHAPSTTAPRTAQSMNFFMRSR